MSYFVFGCVTGDISMSVRGAIVVASKREATMHGIHVFANDDITQAVVREMLAEQIGLGSPYEFLFTSRADEDTSDSLISPFECTPEQISSAMESLDLWADGLLRAVPGIAISLFFTEGYETTFAIKKAVRSGWAAQIAQSVIDEGDIPSLRIDLAAILPT